MSVLRSKTLRIIRIHQTNASNGEAKDFKTWLIYDFPRIQSPLFGSTIVVSTLDDFLEQSVNSLCDFAEEIQDTNNKPSFPDCKPLQGIKNESSTEQSFSKTQQSNAASNELLLNGKHIFGQNGSEGTENVDSKQQQKRENICSTTNDENKNKKRKLDENTKKKMETRSLCESNEPKSTFEMVHSKT